MKKQVSWIEILGMLAGPVAAYFAYRYSRVLFSGLLADAAGIGGLLLAMLFMAFLPSFLAVFAATLLQSNRYRIVNASLATFVIVVLIASLGFRMIGNLQSFVIWCVFLACAMGAALAATQLWKVLGKISSRRTEVAAAPLSAAGEAPPRASPFLTALAVLSVPVVVVNILASTFVSMGIAAALLFILLQLPRIPVFLLLGAALVPLAAIWTAVTALVAVFRGGRSEHPAIGLPEESEGELYALAGDVARLVGTKPPDKVILHLFPTFFVTQGKAELLDGAASGRILALGMPMIGKLDGRELRAVLAHEFAHFAGGDLAYSTLVAPAYRALGTALHSLSNTAVGGGTGAVMSILRKPSVLFLANSYEYFATIDRMLQRGRELRADRAAAKLYGKRSLVSSLEKATILSELYNKTVASVRPTEAGAFFAAADAAIDADPRSREEASRALLAQAEDPLDTHPSFAARADALPDLAGSVPAEASMGVPSLEVEGRRLSELAVRKFGIELAAEA